MPQVVEHNGIKVIVGATKEDPYIITDWPWGRKLKCEIHFWIETKEKLGQRVVRQTQDPRTGRWCTPKNGQYLEVKVLYIDSEGKIQENGIWTHEHSNDTGETCDQDLLAFSQTYAPAMGEWETNRLETVKKVRLALKERYQNTRIVVTTEQTSLR